jgi:hypothetical protein
MVGQRQGHHSRSLKMKLGREDHWAVVWPSLHWRESTMLWWPYGKGAGQVNTPTFLLPSFVCYVFPVFKPSSERPERISLLWSLWLQRTGLGGKWLMSSSESFCQGKGWSSEHHVRSSTVVTWCIVKFSVRVVFPQEADHVNILGYTNIT